MHQNDLFQRVVGFRHFCGIETLGPPSKSFHLFQRVVGFQLVVRGSLTNLSKILFPSLSESSGFPTMTHIYKHYRNITRCFHLFQRVVGFQPFSNDGTFCLNSNEFPSLSESSGFPTLEEVLFMYYVHKYGFHLFQRVVGFQQ